MRIAVEHLNRQRAQPLCQIAKPHAWGGATAAREQPGTLRGRRRGDTRSEPQFARAARKTRGDRRDALEKFQACGDFKQQSLWTARRGLWFPGAVDQRDVRGVAAGPCGHVLEGGAFRLRIAFVKTQVRRERRRRRTHHAWTHSLRESRCVAVEDVAVFRQRPGISRG